MHDDFQNGTQAVVSVCYLSVHWPPSKSVAQSFEALKPGIVLSCLPVHMRCGLFSNTQQFSSTLRICCVEQPVLQIHSFFNTSQNFSAVAVSALATLPHTLTLWKPTRCLNLLNQPFLEPSQ